MMMKKIVQFSDKDMMMVRMMMKRKNNTSIKENGNSHLKKLTVGKQNVHRLDMCTKEIILFIYDLYHTEAFFPSFSVSHLTSSSMTVEDLVPAHMPCMMMMTIYRVQIYPCCNSMLIVLEQSQSSS